MNKKEILKKAAVAGACIIIFTVADVYAADGLTRSLSKMDSFGFKFLKLVQGIGYWIVVVKGSADIYKKIIEGDLHGCVKAAISYMLGFGLVKNFPAILKMVPGVF